MRQTTSKFRDIGLGLAVSLGLCGAIAAAQLKPGAIQKDPGEPCCSITAIDITTRVITAKDKKTGQVFKLEGIAATALAKFKVGEGLNVSCAVPAGGGTMGSTGSAASSGSGPCPGGSNVPRNADTRPKDCVATNSAGVQTPIPCPQGYVIKVVK